MKCITYEDLETFKKLSEKNIANYLKIHYNLGTIFIEICFFKKHDNYHKLTYA